MSRNELVHKDKIHTLFNSSLRLLSPAIMSYVSEFIPRSNNIIETSTSSETEEMPSYLVPEQTSVNMTTLLSQEEDTITHAIQSTQPLGIKQPAATPRRKQFSQVNKRKADCSDAATKRVKGAKSPPIPPTYEPSTSVVHVLSETLPIGGETNASICNNSGCATLKEENDSLKKELEAAKEFLIQMEEVNHQQHMTYQKEIERLTTQVESLNQERDNYQQALTTTQQTNATIVQQLRSDLDRANQTLADSNKANERLKQVIETTEEAILPLHVLSSTNEGDQYASKPPRRTIEEKRLEYRIAIFKMRKVKMPADGNCLFHSIGHHVGMSHVEVRQLIAKWLADNKNFSISNDVSFQGYESNWDNYVKEMSTLSTLGTTPCFFAAGEIFGRRIAVISGSVDGSEHIVTHIPPNFKNEKDILVCFADKHFDALENDETILVPTMSEKEFMDKTWYCKSCSKENELDDIKCSSCGEMTEDPTIELWNCKMCTFNNQQENVVCDMCSNSR